MATAKTTKWNKKSGNVSQFKPRSVPALAKDREPTPPGLPDYQTYLPYSDLEGTQDKSDGKKRMMVLVDGDQMQPIKWFNMSLLEGAVTASEVCRIMVMELVQAVIKREGEIAEQNGKNDAMMERLESLLKRASGDAATEETE